MEISKLKKQAKLWGGDVVIVSEKKFDEIKNHKNFFESPFASYNLGSDWKNKLIYCGKDAQWPGIIHEMGHVFTMKSAPSDRRGNEYSFFGWEYLLAHLVSRYPSKWIISNKDYAVGVNHNTMDFGKLNAKEKKSILAERIAFAVKIGIVKNGIPQAIR